MIPVENLMNNKMSPVISENIRDMTGGEIGISSYGESAAALSPYGGRIPIGRGVRDFPYSRHRSRQVKLAVVPSRT